MNARQLLQHLQEGAKLSSRWSYGKLYNRLTLPSGEVLFVQRSNIRALLKAGTLRSIPFSGDNYEYYLPEQK